MTYNGFVRCGWSYDANGKSNTALILKVYPALEYDMVEGNAGDPTCDLFVKNVDATRMAAIVADARFPSWGWAEVVVEAP